MRPATDLTLHAHAHLALFPTTAEKFFYLPSARINRLQSRNLCYLCMCACVRVLKLGRLPAKMMCLWRSVFPACSGFSVSLSFPFRFVVRRLPVVVFLLPNAFYAKTDTHRSLEPHSDAGKTTHMRCMFRIHIGAPKRFGTTDTPSVPIVDACRFDCDRPNVCAFSLTKRRVMSLASRTTSRFGAWVFLARHFSSQASGRNSIQPLR